jgi:hypothetical protein
LALPEPESVFHPYALDINVPRRQPIEHRAEGQTPACKAWPQAILRNQSLVRIVRTFLPFPDPPALGQEAELLMSVLRLEFCRRRLIPQQVPGGEFKVDRLEK